jgi:hypothetical protein
MTRSRRRVVRLAHLLKVACLEPVFVGCSYREMQTNLERQLDCLAPSRRKAARRQALNLISAAGGLQCAADHLVPRSLQQGSTVSEPQDQAPPTQTLHRSPEPPRCSVCRMRLGRRKRSFQTEAAARQVCEIQRDPGLVVYACEAGEGWHLGHRPTNPATSTDPATTAHGREPIHLVNAHVAPMLPNPLHKESPMKMQVTLGHPILIAIYSMALLFIGCGVGVRFSHTLPTALWLCAAGSILVAVHDLATGFVWFWLTAKWVRSVMIQRDKRG